MKRILLFAILLALCSTSFAQDRNVTGTVTSEEDGTPIPGVNVILKGSSSGTVTDIDGKYTISVPAEGGMLVYTFIGLATEEVDIGNQSVIDMVMTADIRQLTEVVITGFGEQSKKTLTSSISSINQKEFENLSVPTFEGVLQGRTSGVIVNSTSGTIGSPVTVRVRGTTSINASAEPLYVVDGIPVTQGQFGSDAGANGQNALVNLNPNDIASIEILKDASATALYGARAANGVVLITTKKGEYTGGKPSVSVGVYGGTTEPTKTLQQMNGQQFATIWNEASANFILDLGFANDIEEARLLQSEDDIFGLYLNPEEQPSTDWVDEVTRRGSIQEYYANISGGDDNLQYYVGGTYRDEQAYIIKNRLQRYSLRSNITKKLGKKVNMNLSLSPTRTVINRVSQDNAVAAPLTNAYLAYPNVENRDANGNLIVDVVEELQNTAFGDLSTQFGAGTPTVNLEEQEFEAVNTQVLGNLGVDWEIIKGLLFKTQLSVESWGLNEYRKDGERTIDGFPLGTGSAINELIFNYVWNNTLNYSFDLNNKHNFNILLGTQWQESDRKQIQAFGNTFASDAFIRLNSAAVPTTVGSLGTQFAFFGILGRINYDFNNKYLVSFSARYDRTSRFADGNNGGFFPAISAGWNMADESFLENADWLTVLKLRGSYGSTGNAEIGNFDYLTLVAGDGTYNNQAGYRISQIGNNNLTWETTNQFDVGIDFGFLNNKLRGTLAYYQKNTTDLLLDDPLPATSGFTTVFKNAGEIENKGFEFDLSWDVFQSEFSWTTSINFSTLQNRVVSLPGGEDIFFAENIVREGEALGAFYLVEYAGVNPEDGTGMYKRQNSEGVFEIDSTGGYSTNDRIIAGDPFPDWFGGWNNTMTFKGFDLNFFFQFNFGNDVYREEGEFTETNLGSIFNQDVNQLDFWTPENPNASVPRPVFVTNNGARASTRYLSDGSFVRLKTISLGYTFPEKLVGKTRLRLFVQGQNLLTFTDYTGADPEVNSARTGNLNVQQGNTFFAAPQQKTLAFGINATF